MAWSIIRGTPSLGKSSSSRAEWDRRPAPLDVKSRFGVEIAPTPLVAVAIAVILETRPAIKSGIAPA
jgi:hypothetical protein